MPSKPSKTTTKAASKAAKPRTPSASVTLTHRIHALLNTVRHIAHCEDEICTLLHEAEHSKEITPALARDLKRLLTRMPSPGAYLADIEAIRSTLTPAKPTAKKSSTRKK